MRIGKRRISKRLVFILVPVVLVLGGAGAALAADELPFTDIAGNTHEQSIVNMADRGITTGYPDGTFRPDNPVTRGQMMTFLDRYTSGMGCTDCHNDTTIIVSKEAQFKERSVHGTGEAFEEGTRTACAGCHGTEGAKARINAGLPPHDPSVAGIVNVTPFDCRTCHNMHSTYTGADWSLTGLEQPVKMEYTSGTFDKGAGNLCANCHQVRNPLPVATDGSVKVTSTRFGPHYGVQANMLLGEGGLGGTGSASPHYDFLGESCVSCHMGDESNHTYEPQVARCTSCHSGLEDFDRNGVQTKIQGMLDELKPLLISNGIMNADDELSIPGTYPEAVAQAMWNYKVVNYDASLGVHNAAYAEALLQSSLDALQ